MPQARPLFTGPDGRPLQGFIAVYQVVTRYDRGQRGAVGLPRALEFVGAFTGSHTAAAGEARERGALPADADAVTVSVRNVSAVDVARVPAGAGEGAGS